MDEMRTVHDLQAKTRLVLALKTESGQAIADSLATRLANSLHQLLVTASKDEDLIRIMYEIRGGVNMLAAIGYDVRQVLDLAAKNAVKQQMHLTKPPTIRRDDERSTEGETEDGQ